MTKMTPKQTALICGAGIGGLTAALALARRGWSVSVVEQAEELSEVGAGIQLSPNAMHVLQALHLGDAIARVSFEPLASTIRDYATGLAHMDQPLKGLCQSRYGAPYLHIYRPDLHKLLRDAAQTAGVSILLGQTAKSVSQTETQAHLHTQSGTRSGDVLIGADGLRSVVRDAILKPELPRFTGQVAWRGTIPTEALPQNLIAPKATVWVGPHHHFVTYYIKSGQLVNFVAVQERADWTKTGWNEPGDVGELREAFKDWHPEVRTLLDATQECYLWALHARDPLPKWSEHRATLLGDAAHPMLPFMAQGAAMAIEDAWVLADALTNAPVQTALKRYEAARMPRTAMVQKMSQDNAKLFHRSQSLSDLWPRAKLRIARLFPKAPLYQLDKIYGVNVTQETR